MGRLESFMGSGSFNEDMEALLSNFIREHFGEEVMLNKFIVITELVEPNDRTLAFYATPGMKVWESKGLLDSSLSFEENHLSQMIDPDDDDDDLV